jgi:CRP-like cAMP-binding protein
LKLSLPPYKLRSSVPHPRPLNRLLTSLPDDTFARLAADLKTLPLTRNKVFYRYGDLVDHVYFPNGGVASVSTAGADGRLVEAASIGDEGMLGIEASVGEGARSQNDVTMQVPHSNIEVLSAAAFRREVTRGTALHELIDRYRRALSGQMRQSAACNALHSIRSRCCCWLLQTHDRMHRDEFELSQEYLAIMLGVRRQSVPAVSMALQDAGAIAYTHGHMVVLDRARLEVGSCECYRAIRAQFDRLRL